MNIIYTGWIIGTIGKNSEEFIIKNSETNFEMLIDELANINPAYKRVFSHKNVIYGALLNEVIDKGKILNNVDTITIFSPIAGG